MRHRVDTHEEEYQLQSAKTRSLSNTLVNALPGMHVDFALPSFSISSSFFLCFEIIASLSMPFTTKRDGKDDCDDDEKGMMHW